jgi:hypothetical protein
MFLLPRRAAAAAARTLSNTHTHTFNHTRGLATLFSEEDKAFHVYNLLEAKKKAKVSFDDIAAKTGTYI